MQLRNQQRRHASCQLRSLFIYIVGLRICTTLLPLRLLRNQAGIPTSCYLFEYVLLLSFNEALFILLQSTVAKILDRHTLQRLFDTVIRRTSFTATLGFSAHAGFSNSGRRLGEGDRLESKWERYEAGTIAGAFGGREREGERLT